MRGLDDLPSPALPARRYPAPLGASRVLSVIEMLRLPPGGNLLDLAAGAGGVLLDAVALSDGRGVGLIAAQADLAAARAAAAGEGLEARAEFVLATAAAFDTAQRFDAILSIRSLASTAPVPGLDPGRSLGWLRPGGVLVVGEPFFRRPPSPAYRALLGDAATAIGGPGASARAIVAAGYELLVSATLSETEWDAEASSSYRAALAAAAACADARLAGALRERADARYHGYWDFGRDTLGYAFQAFRRARSLNVVARARQP